MHVTDWFTTLLRAAGMEVPADRVIDGVDQLAWLKGDQQSSLREGYIFHSWTATHFNRLLGEFQGSVKRETPVPAGAPLDYRPAKPA
jgi:arylsulfatase A-like enzyme